VAWSVGRRRGVESIEGFFDQLQSLVRPAGELADMADLSFRIEGAEVERFAAAPFINFGSRLIVATPAAACAT